MVAPFFLPRSVANSTADDSLRLMVANVFVGNTNAQPLIAMIRNEQPDAVVLIEVKESWMQRLAPLRDEYPQALVANRDTGSDFGPFGMAVFSRRPIEMSEIHHVTNVALPIIEFELLHDGVYWTITAAHPYPPVSARCATIRNAYLAELATIMREVEGPGVVLGDLNITQFSPHFVKFKKSAGLVDSSRGYGYQPTWPDWLPCPIIPIDHALVTPNINVVDRRVGPSIDSDHRPVTVDLIR